MDQKSEKAGISLADVVPGPMKRVGYSLGDMSSLDVPHSAHRRSLSGTHEYLTDFEAHRTPTETVTNPTKEAGPPISKV